jgi:hypothetical protein
MKDYKLICQRQSELIEYYSLHFRTNEQFVYDKIREIESELSDLQQEPEEVEEYRQQSVPTDEEIEEWINRFLQHEAFKVPLPDDNEESAAIRACRYGIRTGAKAMRDNKIKPQNK